MKQMYYRTYIIAFTRSDGVHYYAGKRKSKYIDPFDDPYTGSSVELSNAIKKYGKKCIIEIQWFEHTEETYDSEEIELIKRLKELHGSRCINKAAGGNGGDTQKFSTIEEKRITSIKRSTVANKHWSDPNQRTRQSGFMKAYYENDANRLKMSNAIRQAFTREDAKENKRIASIEVNSRQGMKERKSKSVSDSKRISPVWDLYNNGILLDLWLDSGKMGYKSFAKWMRTHGYDYPPSKYQKAIYQLKSDTND